MNNEINRMILEISGKAAVLNQAIANCTDRQIVLETNNEY